MNIRLTTLGGFRVAADGREVGSVLSQPARAALLTFLALEGQVSRDSLTTVFWPESDTERSRHALRQALYHLRGILGHEWIESHGHELRVSPDVHVDAHAFAAALERGDAEAAARMYEGPFLDGVHLLDLAPWETWVDTRRAQLARDFRRACRAWVEERRRVGDFAGAIEAAEHWVAPDPLDDEAQHALVRALAEAGERAEAIRQYEAYARALEPEGLRPLDETRDLVEGLDRVSIEPSGLGATHPSDPEPPVKRGATAGARGAPGSRRSLVGVVFLLTALLATGYLVSRPPTDSLVARGSIAEGERIILADFESTAADPALGEVVTDALRIDLVEAPILTPVEPAEIRSALDRMQVADDRPLTEELAREVALREGVKAVLAGDVSRAGTGYVLTATLRLADTGESLAGFRETAEAEEELIPAIDRLSRRIRERAGESLSSVRATPPLERVTTSSLAALRLLSRARRTFDGDYDRMIPLLEEAIALDPDFAMAWRRLAVALGNTETDRVRELEAATRAYELRHLLTPRERYLATARYHGQVTHDRDAMVHAYLRVLEIDPDDRMGLNNLGGEYLDRQDYAAAAELLERAVTGPGESATAYVNLIQARIALTDVPGASRVADAFAERYPDHQEVPFWHFWVLLLQDDEPAARSQLEPLVADPSLPPTVRARAHDHLARLALRRGRMAEAREHLANAERIGQQVGPAFRLVRRLFRAHAEVAVGDPARGHRLLREAEDEGCSRSYPRRTGGTSCGRSSSRWVGGPRKRTRCSARSRRTCRSSFTTSSGSATSRRGLSSSFRRAMRTLPSSPWRGFARAVGAGRASPSGWGGRCGTRTG
jgi:DNA-binding SARP family transcriptional activator/Tfp pilus assembly protein PilF